MQFIITNNCLQIVSLRCITERKFTSSISIVDHLFGDTDEEKQNLQILEKFAGRCRQSKWRGGDGERGRRERRERRERRREINEKTSVKRKRYQKGFSDPCATVRACVDVVKFFFYRRAAPFAERKSATYCASAFRCDRLRAKRKNQENVNKRNTSGSVRTCTSPHRSVWVKAVLAAMWNARKRVGARLDRNFRATFRRTGISVSASSDRAETQ